MGLVENCVLLQRDKGKKTEKIALKGKLPLVYFLPRSFLSNPSSRWLLPSIKGGGGGTFFLAGHSKP